MRGGNIAARARNSPRLPHPRAERRRSGSMRMAGARDARRWALSRAGWPRKLRLGRLRRGPARRRSAGRRWIVVPCSVRAGGGRRLLSGRRGRDGTLLDRLSVGLVPLVAAPCSSHLSRLRRHLGRGRTQLVRQFCPQILSSPFFARQDGAALAAISTITVRFSTCGGGAQPGLAARGLRNPASAQRSRRHPGFGRLLRSSAAALAGARAGFIAALFLAC